MGILNNTVSLCQFQVLGDQPQGDLFTWIGEALTQHGFRSIEHKQSQGWVQLDDFQESGFAGEHTYRREHYVTFSLRCDQRKLPAALLKPYLKKAEADWLEANPKYKRVPKLQRDALRDAVRGSLFARTLPVPAIYDAVWDTRSNLVSFTSLGSRATEAFTTLFSKSFDGLRLVPYHPMARAARVADAALQPALKKANASSSEAVLEQIEANQWLGKDLLLWLMHQTMNESAEFRVNRPGPALENEGFVAYLNDRLLLAASGEQGVQRVTVSGPQDRFSEVRTAVQGGKEIYESVLYLEKLERQWKMTLKADTFHFASFKAPGVTLEKDEITDPALEREAVFYERMALVEEGLQLFDSLLATFLQNRLGDGWSAQEQSIRNELAA